MSNQQVVDLMCRMTNWPVGHVYEMSTIHVDVLEPTKIWHLEDPNAYEVFREVTERTNFRRGEGLPGRILASGKPAWIVNVQKDTNFPRNRLARNLGVKGAFGFPVKIRGEIVAVVEFFGGLAALRTKRSLGPFERVRALPVFATVRSVPPAAGFL